MWDEIIQYFVIKTFTCNLICLLIGADAILVIAIRRMYFDQMPAARQQIASHIDTYSNLLGMYFICTTKHSLTLI